LLRVDAKALALKTGVSGFYFRQAYSSSQWRFYKPNKIRRDRLRRGCAARKSSRPARFPGHIQADGLRRHIPA
jgi:hypothetical protein